ncbi:hypothetical protein ACVR0O_02045 [Streptococcus caviae]|uniref:hypothetical protein n=1 Tax=Streptococcus sp. 'caviae' TaxID=1915004 RepID=UPI00094B93D2|nr:hypothetical protein [Streptococcus sp. 'caviae']OLN83778.1 hypothetical protein BMI76_03615 [Streptococcus sp. 'caviae']
MKKINSKIYLVGLSVAGMLSCLLPWSGVYMGSIPPGDLPNKIFYGYQKNGIICGACFAFILLICLLTSVKKPMSRTVARANLFLSLISLAVCLWDIVGIMLKSGMVGAVPLLEVGPFVMGVIAILTIVIVIAAVRRKS